MKTKQLRSMAVCVAVVGACAVWTPAAAAATFSVNPTQISLAGRTTSALLTVRNESDQPLRFQVTAFAWTQSASGEIELAPTNDVVFFPKMLVLNPKEERRVRIGSTVAAAASEKTYRIFVEELPPITSSQESVAIRVLTKMGIPIFLRPATATASATLAGLGVREGSLRFTVANQGTVHFVPQEIKVSGVSATGQTLFEREVSGWYILAGGRRDFDVALPAASCAEIASLRVQVALGSEPLKEMLQTPAGTCGSGN
jgi:fimbrial chaperone protein